MSAPPEGRLGLAGSAAVMFSGTLVSRLLGLVRNVVLVAAIGVTGAANSFAVANRLPNVVYMLVAGGVLNAILVPQIVRAMKARDGGDEYVNRLLTMAGAALLALTTLLTAGAGVLVTIYASELDPQWFTLAVTFAIWCIPQLFFYGMYTLLGQVLNARGIFGPYMWAPAVNNLVSIIGLVAYLVLFGGTATGAHTDPSAWTGTRIVLIAGTATLGVASQAVILILPLRRAGFRFRPRWGLRGSGLGRASRVATWAFASLGVAQLGFIAISNLAAAAASALTPRGVAAVAELPAIASRAATFVPGNAAWDNANFLYMLPQSLITVSLVTALFTRVSDYAATGNTTAVRTDLSLGLRTIGVFTVFAGGALAVVALPLIQTVLPTTTVAEAEGIARVVVALLAGIAALGAFTMIQRVYYAFEDTRSLFRLQVPLTAIVIVGCLLATFLPPTWWLVGAAVATTLSNVVGALVAYLALRLKLPSLDGRRVLRTHLRLVLAAAPAVLVGWALLTAVGPAALADSTLLRMVQALWRVALTGLVMCVVYVLLLRRLRVGELDTMLRPFGSLLGGVARRLPQPLARWATALAGRLGGEAAVRTMSGQQSTTSGRHEGNRTLDRHTSHSAPSLSAGTVLSGRYLLQRELDPMLPGTVLWQGRDQILDRVVNALVLPGTTGRSGEALDAARRAALVDDPRLQRILDVGQHADYGYVVTDVAGGPTLAQLTATASLPPAQARAVVGEAASALETARRRGVHHLALTPAAVHLTPDGQVKLAGAAVAAAYLGIDDDPLAASRADATGLVRLLYGCLTGHWPRSEDLDATPQPETADGDLPDAPLTDGVPTPSAELRADVPADLDELCRRTLRPGNDGPRTPGELIRELAPWLDINVTALAGQSAAPWATDGASLAAAAVAVPPVDPPAPTSPLPIARPSGAPEPRGGEDEADKADEADEADEAPQHTAAEPQLDSSRWQPRPLADRPRTTEFGEVLEAGNEAASDDSVAGARHHRGSAVWATLGAAAGGVAAAVAATARSGGAAVRTKVTEQREALAARSESRAADRAAREEEAEAADREADVAAALRHGSAPRQSASQPEPQPAPQPPPAPPAPEPPAEGDRPSDEPAPFRERRLDPTPIVLVIAVLAVLVGAVLAVRTLFADTEPPADPAPTVTQDAAPSPATEDTTEPEPATEPEPEPEPTEPAEPPQIATMAPLDPEGDGAENPDLTGRALDGDDSTFWRSRSYVDPAYGMKSGIGLAVTLEAETQVSAVTFDLMGQGGNVEIRVTDPTTPTEGEVLAEGEMGPDTTFTFAEPVTTDELVLWFTELPVAASDGRNRVELAELGVE